ncbi:hypothetical protein QEV83_08105 [Methylocapsa sp. D3K7]|uniref:EpsG family protein n=1 Tax=Methylocapsa sp. D3K7 TaxID=3041435 RepID=UPI00244EAE8F|nr:hypothetical protein [Methylocapsa sp. D3K7]WGJ16192.1 hypothetical protein QEV83_08105 [Methylocapsa sp. D3K7]
MAYESHQPSAIAGFSDRSLKAASKDGSQIFVWLRSLASLLIITSVSFLMADRELYTAFDDENNIAYFKADSAEIVQRISSLQDPKFLVFDEPLWDIYTAFTGILLGPEDAFRLTLFLSTFLFLYCSTILGGGNWIIITFLFLIHYGLATQMYYNQMRQGVALSVFLVLLVSLKILSNSSRKIFSSFIAIFIHTSFLVVFASALVSAMKPIIRIIVGILGISTLLLLFQTQDLFEFVNAGRREGLYEGTDSLNLNFYISKIPVYAAIFYLLLPRKNDLDNSEFYHFTLILTIISISLTLVHSAGARLINNSEAMMCILVARNIKFRAGQVAFGIFVFSIVVTNIFVDRQATVASQESIITRWQLILFSEPYY